MKYIIKFKKQGRVRFISHLDLQKVFLRVFRIIGIKPKYSNGFNPHPKLSFALPLSLGFASETEYLELETEDNIGLDIDQTLKKLKDRLPDGLEIVYIQKKPDEMNKKLASYIDCAEYSITCPYFNDPKSSLKKYMNRNSIYYDKKSRKTGKVKEVDIKPSIYKLKIDMVNDNNIRLSAILHAGNDSVLNPIVMIESLFRYLDTGLDTDSLSITRKKVYCIINGKLSDADQVLGR